MSHYTVAVIVDKLDENEVAKMLAPYQENNMGDCPREYLAFNSITEEYKKTYEEGTRAMILIDDNKLVSEYDDMFKKEIVEEGHCFPTTTYEVPEKYRKVEIPYKLLYPTFDDFMKEYEGETKDEETNDYGYWENPNRKWDWHEKGEMGWWGFDTSTGDSERAFIEKFNAELKNIDNQEKYIVLVDCHI